jgi:hypothetical protein
MEWFYNVLGHKSIERINPKNIYKCYWVPTKNVPKIFTMPRTFETDKK